MKLSFILNHSPVAVETRPDRRVVDLLREDLGLTGTKEGCGSGECGACSIRVDGVIRLACLMLAAQIEGRHIETIEGVSVSKSGGELHPVQDAFIRAGAIQCGFCTPGMVMTVVDFLDSVSNPNDEQIKEALSGNLCRCTGYQKIFDAVRLAVEEGKTNDA